MSKADVLALVQTLALDLADTLLIDRYYTETVRLLGQREWLTQASLLPTVSGTGAYSLPDTAVRLLAVFYDDRLLPVAPLAEMLAIDPQWRERLGTPTVHITEDETTGDLVLYPIPDHSSKDFIFLFGSPLGLDYPEYALAVIHTEERQDVPTYLELPIALLICAREFARESDHRDVAFADACARLADLSLGLVAGEAPRVAQETAHAA